MNEINAGYRYGISGASKPSGSSSEKPEEVSQNVQDIQNSKQDTIDLSSKQGVSVTYSNVQSKKLSSSQIADLQAQADIATENLRKLVEQLILKQGKNYKAADEAASQDQLNQLGITTDDVEAANQAISEDGDYGVKAVSDRLVNFAINVSGGDKSKLSELMSAIDKGFSAAKDAWGGELPDICQQTYDETMKKLKDWANSEDQ